MTLGEIIEKYRTSHHLSQRQFAKLCGVSNGYISMLERGFNPNTGEPIEPTLMQIKKISDGLNMSIDDLISIADDIPIRLSDDDWCVDDIDQLIGGVQRVSTISDRLQIIMNERNLKQSDILNLAKPFCDEYHIKLGKSDLSQFVNGKHEPRRSKLTVLALALNVSDAWLLGYDVPISSKEGLLLYDRAPTLTPPLTPHESTVITAYRKQPAMQPAVDRLLGVTPLGDAPVITRIAASGGGVQTDVDNSTEDAENLDDFSADGS